MFDFDDNTVGCCEICGEAVHTDDAYIEMESNGERAIAHCDCAEPDYDDDFPMYLEYDDWKYDHIDTGDDW